MNRRNSQTVAGSHHGSQRHPAGVGWWRDWLRSRRERQYAAPWAPCTISGNRSIPRRPTPCARRSTTPGGTSRHRATFSAHGFRLIGRANGSPSASPTWCNVGNAIPTISPRMRSTIWRGALPHEDNGDETCLRPVRRVNSRYHGSATDGPCCTAKAPVIGTPRPEHVPILADRAGSCGQFCTDAVAP